MAGIALDDTVGTTPSPSRRVWFAPLLTVLLAALAVLQAAFLVPLSVHAAQRFGMELPWHLDLLRRAPLWAVAVLALGALLLALRRRVSERRALLLAAAILAVNVGLVLSISGTQARLLWSLGH